MIHQKLTLKGNCMEKFNFNKAFKDTMDSLNVRNDRLAELSGRSVANISKIRNSKAFPSVEDFAKLIEYGEQLQPGFAAEFAHRLTNSSFFSPETLINSLDSSQLSVLIYAIGQRVSNTGRKEQVIH